jgi:acetylglutamate kinase
MELISVKGLRAALPYLRHFGGKLFVVKVGGEALESRETIDSLVEQLTILHQLGIRFVLVHGGGTQATQLGEKLSVESTFIEGRRVTSPEAVDVLVMALNGTARTAILSSCRRHQLPAVGVSGVDAGIVRAEKRPEVKISDGTKVNYGQVGNICGLNLEPLRGLIEMGTVPVVSSLSADDAGTVLNINADDVAAALAVGLQATKLVMVTQPRGILTDIADPQSLISELTLAELADLEAKGTIKTGMLPKSKAVRTALIGGVQSVHIVSYDFPDAILVEVFTNEGCGTMIVHGATA